MDSKISNLNTANDLLDENVVPIVNGSETKKTTLLLIYNYLKDKFDLVYTTTSAVATQITTALNGYATQSYVNSRGFITNVVSSLGYTPLNKAGDTITGDILNTATGYFDVPSGTTAQRPSSPVDGMLRYNSTTLRFEFYANGAWRNNARLEGDTFTGNVFAPNLSRIIVKDVTAGSTITGTTAETLTGTYFVPGNTFTANDVKRISSFLAEKTGIAGTVTMRVKVGPTASFGSATTIATYTTGANELWCIMNRLAITLRGGNLRTLLTGSSRQTDIVATTVAISTVSFNPAVDNWVFTSLQLSVSTDSVFQSNLLITN